SANFSRLKSTHTIYGILSDVIQASIQYLRLSRDPLTTSSLSSSSFCADIELIKDCISQLMAKCKSKPSMDRQNDDIGCSNQPSVVVITAFNEGKFLCFLKFNHGLMSVG
ncbi:unnamed protein product, partial [Trichobilharzia regenti]